MRKWETRRTKPDQMVTTSLDVITVINGIVQVGGDAERQSRNIFNRNVAFMNLINNLKKRIVQILMFKLWLKTN